MGFLTLPAVQRQAYGKEKGKGPGSGSAPRHM
jgi:hypothetical protein